MQTRAGIFLTGIMIIGLAAMALVLVLNYNGLVKASKTIDEEKAQIETAFQRRLDLLPNLIETVKGYAYHEQSVLDNITRVRAEAVQHLQQVKAKSSPNADDLKTLEDSQSAVTATVRGFMLTVENYPDLKASSNFLALQDQMEGSENRIAVARNRYNHAVRIYDSKIETFPGVFIAPAFGYKEKAFFEAKPEAREAIKAAFKTE